METVRNWGRFWGEVLKMWAREHGLNISLVWKLSPFLSILGIIGVITFKEPWQSISWGILGLGSFILFFSLCFVFPYKKWKQDTDELRTQIDTLAPLADIEREQLGNEGNWLRLVVEMIDLGRHTNRPKREIRVLFQIDSSLIYDFQPYRMWVSPILGGWEANEPEHEIRQPPNLLKGQRSQLSCIDIPIKDEKLWEAVKDIREGKDITKALKIEMQLASGKSPIGLKSYPSYPDKVNDTRQ